PPGRDCTQGVTSGLGFLPAPAFFLALCTTSANKASLKTQKRPFSISSSPSFKAARSSSRFSSWLTHTADCVTDKLCCVGVESRFHLGLDIAFVDWWKVDVHIMPLF